MTGLQLAASATDIDHSDYPPNSLYRPSQKRKLSRTLPQRDGEEDGGGGGDYFALPGQHGRSSQHAAGDGWLPMHAPTGPSPTEMALTALQYLPMPMLVLSSSKTVVLANEAMGRLLSVDTLPLADGHSPGMVEPSITDMLQHRTLSELGIDMVKNGAAVWVKWEVSLPNPCRHFIFANTVVALS